MFLKIVADSICRCCCSEVIDDISPDCFKRLPVPDLDSFADIFFMILLIPVALSAFPNLTNTLMDVDLYIYYIMWILFVVFLMLCMAEMKKELKPKKIKTEE